MTNSSYTFTTLAGIGDEAYLEHDNVFLRKGSEWVQVNVVSRDAAPDHLQAALQTVAQKITGELARGVPWPERPGGPFRRIS